MSDCPAINQDEWGHQTPCTGQEGHEPPHTAYWREKYNGEWAAGLRWIDPPAED